ncbi:MAG: EVE domain-containing protein [Gammaproteobacteria bacterium]|nr:EVE domain-containing protein [Gammaproteobacteria bacterium]NKB65394.1 EVE domain-containing protein [Gammaproteobacteria bacterium]
MQYWLMKSEPDAFSIDDLQKVGTEPWDGIRNYQARNFMRDDMKIGDLVFFYHSSCKIPGIVGLMEVASESYPDFTAFDSNEKYFDSRSNPEKPTWMMVDVKFVQKLAVPITLQSLKQNPKLDGMRLLQKGNRLSIMPVEKVHWDTIMDMTNV